MEDCKKWIVCGEGCPRICECNERSGSVDVSQSPALCVTEIPAPLPAKWWAPAEKVYFASRLEYNKTFVVFALQSPFIYPQRGCFINSSLSSSNWLIHTHAERSFRHLCQVSVETPGVNHAWNVCSPLLNYAMNFCVTIALATETSYQRLKTSQCGLDHAGDLFFVQYSRGWLRWGRLVMNKEVCERSPWVLFAWFCLSNENLPWLSLDAMNLVAQSIYGFLCSANPSPVLPSIQSRYRSMDQSWPSCIDFSHHFRSSRTLRSHISLWSITSLTTAWPWRYNMSEDQRVPKTGKLRERSSPICTSLRVSNWKIWWRPWRKYTFSKPRKITLTIDLLSAY